MFIRFLSIKEYDVDRFSLVVVELLEMVHEYLLIKTCPGLLLT